MQRKFSFTEGEYYHIYNRGVDKRKIFLNTSDKKRFIKLLYTLNSDKKVVMRDIRDTDIFTTKRDPLVAIGAYCLMDNHFHILVREIRENGISEFMEKLMTGYTMFFNKKIKEPVVCLRAHLKRSMLTQIFI